MKATEMTQHDHDHGHELEDETYGIALGFRIIEENDKLYLAEAEIAPYIDEQDELGVTLVFHPLEGIDPIEIAEEGDWPAWPVDVDDDFHVDGEQPMAQQFAEIVRQLRALSEDRLRDYLARAREDAANAN